MPAPTLSFLPARLPIFLAESSSAEFNLVFPNSYTMGTASNWEMGLIHEDVMVDNRVPAIVAHTMTIGWTGAETANYLAQGWDKMTWYLKDLAEDKVIIAGPCNTSQLGWSGIGTAHRDTINVFVGSFTATLTLPASQGSGSGGPVAIDDVTGLPEALAGLDGRLDGYDTSVPLIEGRVTALEAEDGDLDGRLDALEATVPDLIPDHLAAPDPHGDRGYTDTAVTAAKAEIRNGAPANGDTLLELHNRLAVLEALGSLATDAELIAAVTALIGSADTDGDTLGELQALINGRLKASENLADVPNKATARANLGVAVGTDVQAYSANLDDLSGQSSTPYGRALLALANQADLQTAVGSVGGGTTAPVRIFAQRTLNTFGRI